MTMIEKRSHKISVKTSRLRKRDAIVVELVEVGQFSNGVFFQCIGGGRSKRWSPLLLMAALQLQQMNFQTNLLHPKRKTGPPLGFKNLGNTCYLNSVLQCLTYTPPLANFCLKSQHSSLCDSASDADRKRNCPFCILERRIARSLSSDLALDAPHKIQSCLRLFADHFRCGRQEDAHEFLRYVIDACHNACLRLKKLRRKESEPFNGSDTVVKEIFGGALQSQVKCLSCGSESNKVDEIMDLSLDVLHSNSVREAMVKFFQPEILDGNNKYKCENCKKLVAARKQMSILQAPNILVIQLKRFEGIFGGKIDKVIPFEEVLVLSNFMNKTSQDLHPEYSLFGSIVHSGYSPESGHYYAYIKDAMGRWYCCNDSYVTLSTLQEVLSEKVYILFFSRAKQRPGPASTDFTANGVKSRNYNCNNATNKNATNSPKAAQKAVHPKTQIEHFSGKNTSTIPKNGRVSSSLQMKFNLGNSGSKRVSATENGNFNVHKSQSSKKNGDVKDIENKENNMVSSINMNGENGMPSLVNGNGVYKNKKVDPVDSKRRQALALPPENGKVQSTGVDSKRADTSENNGTRSKVTTGKEHGSHELYNGRVNGHSDNLGSKRKSHEVDSCILFAKDAQSQVEIKEFKEVLMKEASLVLRSCGWSDEVYSFMHSQKRLCSSEADSSPSSGNALKKKLIADAKPSYIPQIPESLKENFIERLKLLSKKKPILGP